ncbi:MAG: hypothetical protein GXY76_09105 [Chloroflexi bacterium]|nr:hypothetical protein [Chloroflexota bacterium]
MVALAILLVAILALPAQAQQGLTYNTLRMYGFMNEGAGADVTDPQTGLPVEDRPYTLADAPFLPQSVQAPIKDSVTWDPAWMYENQTFDENQALGLYNKIFVGGLNASEKVWFREWYEPSHWDKDLNANGLHVFTETGEIDVADEYYPAIMQEFTYLMMEPRYIEAKPEPTWGRVGNTSFVFPIGIRAEDLFTRNGAVDTASDNAKFGYGLTSLDADFDGVPDIVHVDSEVTLFDLTQIAADLNGNRFLDPLDIDNVPLNGNEEAVLRLDTKAIARGSYIQFLDHMVYLKEIFDNSVIVDVWYTGDLTPRKLGERTLFRGDMALSGTNGPVQLISAVRNGGYGSNLCNFPTGPWFVWLASVDTVEESARLMVGRALGATWSSMEDAPGIADRRPGDPWFLKRFYVDGHEYTVSAIYTRGAGTPYSYECDLDLDNNGQVDLQPAPDYSEFMYITLRTPIPKVPVIIEQHSVRLQHYMPLDKLSVLPPFNYEHYILADINALDAFTELYSRDMFIGKLIGPVAPILQKNGPFPYNVEGCERSYSDPSEMDHFYVREVDNPQYTGQLLELYGEEMVGDAEELEYWYAMRYHTMPDQYTEFVFPDIAESRTGADDPDLYLLTSAFYAPQAEYERWIQSQTTGVYEQWTNDRVKFWFDPAIGGKKYKDELGVRLYGRYNEDLVPARSEGAGDTAAVDPVNASYPVEVLPYTDPWAIFNPQLEQAPVKDSLTFNPAYMDEYRNGNEPLAALYPQISCEEQNAREKVFFRQWYEPVYVDKILRLDNPNTTGIDEYDAYEFPAVMQEFTYMYLNMQGEIGDPYSCQPGNSRFAFPISTKAEELPAPVDVELPGGLIPSFGYGLTSYDADFDGIEDIVTVHSENSLANLTGVQADFDGNGVVDQLMAQEGLGGSELSGEELVVFAVENLTLRRGESAQFLDHMVSLENVPGSGSATLKFWYTGGGLHSYPNGVYSLHPDVIQSLDLNLHDMAVVNRTRARLIPAGGQMLGATNGAWFVWLQAINSTQPSRETVSITIGRALGASHSAIDNGNAQHDMEPGDPWYLKRFFVDGHEYNVSAIRVVASPVELPGDESYQFKFITIRTAVPKVNYVNYQDSQKLEGYFLGTVLGVDTNVISVMPPYNYEHTIVEDVEWFHDEDCVGDLRYNRPPMIIRITAEEREPQFFGELREILWIPDDPSRLTPEIWSVEQFNTLPDLYTEFQMPAGEHYLVTTDWISLESEPMVFDTCELGITVTLPITTPRVTFWYDPTDPYDIYVNDEVVEGLAAGATGVVYRYEGPCHATHYLLTDCGVQILIRDTTGTLDNLIGMEVALSGFLYDTVTCDPGIEVDDPNDIDIINGVTPTPTSTVPAATATPTRTNTPPTIPANTATPTATTPAGQATRTPLPGRGHVSGYVQVEGRVNYSGASVALPSVAGANAVTDASGKFTIYDVPAGIYTIVADINRYLYAQKSDVSVTNGNTTVLTDVNLRGGDANDDDTVDIFDLVILGLSYNSTPADPDWDERGDINNDGAVNLWDLVLVGTNYNKTAPTAWSLLMAPKSTALVAPAKSNLALVNLGSDLVVEVKISEATEVFGAEFEMVFDPKAMQVRDADLGRAGIQVENGDMFAADGSFVVENVVDNEKGTVRYAVTMLGSAKAFSGEGTLLRLRFRSAGSAQSAMVSMKGLSLYSKANGAMQFMSDRLLVKLPAAKLAPPLVIK